MIFDEGDQAGSVYVIEGGSILVSKEFDDGRRQIVEMLGPGGVFGITNTNGYVCRAEALRRSRVIAYERTHQLCRPSFPGGSPKARR